MTARPNPDKALEGLLARALRDSASSSAQPCPGADLLAAYFDHSLAAAESIELESHFSSCARCQAHLALLARSEPAPPPRRSSFSIRWLVPVLSGAAAFALWVAIRPAPPQVPSPSAEHEPRAAATPATSPAADATAPLKANEPAPLEKNRSAESLAKSAPAPANSAVTPLRRDHLARQSLEQSASSAASASGELHTRALALAKPAPPAGAPSAAAPAAPAMVESAAAQRADEKKAAADQFAAARRQSALDQIKREESQRVAQAPGLKDSAPSAAKLQDKEVAAIAPKVARSQPSSPEAAAHVSESGEFRAQQAPPPPVPAEAAAANRAAEIRARPGRADDRQESHLEAAQVEADKLPAEKRKAGAAGFQMGMSLTAPNKTVASPDPSILWMYGNRGVILRSTNAGKSWHFQQSGTQQDLLAASAAAKTVCWIVGRSGLVLLTIDGKIWNRLAPPAAEDLTAVTATDAAHATVTSASGRRFSTSDSGRTWKQM